MYIHECAKHACSEGIPFSSTPNNLGGQGFEISYIIVIVVSIFFSIILIYNPYILPISSYHNRGSW